jgi:WD40 repeat protein
VSSDERKVATGNIDGSVTLWDKRSQHKLLPPGTIQFYSGDALHLPIVSGLAFSPDNRLLAVATSDGKITIWDTQSYQHLGRGITLDSPFHGPIERATFRPTVVAFDPTGHTLVVGAYDYLGHAEITLWDARTQTSKVPPLPMPRFPEEIESLAISQDGHLLAAGDRAGTVALWDLSGGPARALALTGRTGPESSLAFNPDNKTLASGTEEGKITLWDLANAQQIPTPLTGPTAPIVSLVFSRDSTMLASAAFDGTVTLWDVSTASWRNRACKIVGPLVTAPQWQLYLQTEEYRNVCS